MPNQHEVLWGKIPLDPKLASIETGMMPQYGALQLAAEISGTEMTDPVTGAPIPGTGEIIVGQLMPLGGAWIFPGPDQLVMILAPKGDRTPGNVGIIPCPRSMDTQMVPWVKFFKGIVEALYMFAGMPLAADLAAPTCTAAVSALQTQLKIFFAVFGGAAPVPPMPYPDGLEKSYLIDKIPYVSVL